MRHGTGIAALLMLAASAASADKLSDFKEAKKYADDNKGCLSIPYRETAETCKRQQEYVHEWCDGKKGPITCGPESTTPNLMKTLVNNYKDLEGLKEKRRGIEDKRSKATSDSDKSQLGKDLEQVDKDIYELNKTIDQSKSNIEARKKLAEDGIYTIEKCLDYRRAVMNNFASAIDTARNESDDIKSIAVDLRAHWEKSKRNHEIQITNTMDALGNCKKARP